MSYLISNPKSPHLWGKEDGGGEIHKIRWIFLKTPALEYLPINNSIGTVKNSHFVEKN